MSYQNNGARERGTKSPAPNAGGRAGLIYFELQPTYVMPRVTVQAYLTRVGLPPEYQATLGKELYRRHFQSAGPLRSLPGDPAEVLGRYVEAMAILQYHVAAALTLVSNKEYYTAAVSSSISANAGVNQTDLTMHALTLLRDQISEYPSLGSVHKLMCEMFPVIKLPNGSFILPIEPSYRELLALQANMMSIYNESEASGSLISNVLTPYGIAGIPQAGYDHLLGLQQTSLQHFNIPSLNPLSKFGWPYKWSEINLAGLGFVSEPLVHYTPGYITEETVSENLLRLAFNHSSAINAGKINAGNGNFPTAVSIMPSETPGDLSPSESGVSVEPRSAKRRGGRS